MSSNIQYKELKDGNNYNSKEKFLFVFTPGFVAEESCCGCSLKTGSIIISIIYMYLYFSNFLFDTGFISAVLFLIYFTAGVLVFLSSMNHNYRNVYHAYLIHAIMYLLSLSHSIIIILLTFFGLYNPTPRLSHFKSGLTYLINCILIFSLQLYYVWIIFSYAIDLKERSKNQAERENNAIPKNKVETTV